MAHRHKPNTTPAGVPPALVAAQHKVASIWCCGLKDRWSLALRKAQRTYVRPAQAALKTVNFGLPRKQAMGEYDTMDKIYLTGKTWLDMSKGTTAPHHVPTRYIFEMH